MNAVNTPMINPPIETQNTDRNIFVPEYVITVLLSNDAVVTSTPFI
jgi:hypothetical protein